MIRIRFHGRGGHGTKTASRIVGTAAFLSGLQAQDSPVYGAERRGAAVVAFTRIDREPVLERGVIEAPDLIIVADETLLDAPEAQILEHADSASAIFINCEDAGALDKYNIPCPLLHLDLTGLTLKELGSAGALSAGLAAVGARLTGVIEQPQLEEALKEEFAHLRLGDELIRRNIAVATTVFESLEPVTFSPDQGRPARKMAMVGFDEPVISAPSVLKPGNAAARQTGAWRFERPVIDPDLCTRCGLCYVRCPDGAVELDDDGFPLIDYAHCKGCMICQQICPLRAVRSEKETRAW